MTPKEKAIELIDKYLEIDASINFEDAKLCAIIAVNEILKLVSDDLDLYYKDCIYWEQVKAEIQAL
jgi:hypothetical protein